MPTNEVPGPDKLGEIVENDADHVVPWRPTYPFPEPYDRASYSAEREHRDYRFPSARFFAAISVTDWFKRHDEFDPAYSEWASSGNGWIRTGAEIIHWQEIYRLHQVISESRDEIGTNLHAVTDWRKLLKSIFISRDERGSGRTVARARIRAILRRGLSFKHQMWLTAVHFAYQDWVEYLWSRFLNVEPSSTHDELLQLRQTPPGWLTVSERQAMAQFWLWRMGIPQVWGFSNLEKKFLALELKNTPDLPSVGMGVGYHRPPSWRE